MVITTIGWIVVGATAWLAMAGVVGVVIGRMIDRRDAQIPTDARTPTAARTADDAQASPVEGVVRGMPEQRTGRHDAGAAVERGRARP